MPATLPCGRQLNPRRCSGPLLGETEGLAGILNVLPSQGKIFLDSSCVCDVKASAMPGLVSRGHRWGKFSLHQCRGSSGSLGRKISAHLGLAIRKETSPGQSVSQLVGASSCTPEGCWV